MLKAGLFEKALWLSADSRTKFPEATIINISTHDVAYFQNYFLKVHDLWSSLFQIFVIFYMVFSLLGQSCLPGQASPLSR